ncbi:MAG: class I SAM-dependent methyltransferase [bacterium]
MRIGSQYRLACLRAYGLEFEGERVLDVGCHDGAFLGSLKAECRVGVDVDPCTDSGTSILIVRADGCRLPFRSDLFDQAVALDVIEHVLADEHLVREMIRVTREKGRLFLTTPSVAIRLFPPFLTVWISSKWGHHWRTGYTADRLRELGSDGCACRLVQWNAPAYRLFYLPLRLLSTVCPWLASRLVIWAAHWDARRNEGHNGFYWMWCEKDGA